MTTLDKTMAASTVPQNPSTQPDTGKDQWAELSKVYSTMKRHPTAPTLTDLIQHANQLLRFKRATSILDVGCGPGLITKYLLTDFADELKPMGPTTKILASDFSPSMIEQVEKIKAEKVEQGDSDWAKVEPSVNDAQSLERFADGSISHVLGGFVYMLIPDPAKGIAAAYRVLQEGGVLCLSAWKDAEWMEVMSATETVRPDKPAHGLPKQWRSVEGISEVLRAHGFKDVGGKEKAAEMGIDDVEKQVDFFMIAIPPLVEALKDFSEEERQKTKELMIERIKKFVPEVPGVLKGTSLVVWGRK